ncbi:LapA family protein [Pseudothioclava nitratireducens]|jgi:uncharacterized integral membrane protein|uniref:LapA family protein n=1 Tax=Pseudothioclava nitratireducens TaxID=1928646 RepID=UPI0023DB1932|nr:LapA family protein [Defluviimonas nitratireducens]MDF1621149.1 LapA family protein [Defluviimonas nitratireducens]
MFKLLRLLFLGAIALILIAVALANRSVVTLQLLPDEIAPYVGSNWSLPVPLFLVIFASILVGLLIGFVWEWLREYKIRSTAVKATRKAQYLEKEVDRLKTRTQGPKDEVLALLDAPSR